MSPHDAAVDLPEGVSSGQLRQSVLEPGTALLELAAGQERLYAYLVKGDTLTFLDLGEREPIERSVAEYSSLIGDPRSPIERVTEVGHALYDRLLSLALAKAGKDLERLVVVPTTSLAVLPFETLVIEPPEAGEGLGEAVLVIDRLEVTYAPSSAVLLDLARRGPRRHDGKLLILADPLYSSEPVEALDSGSPSHGSSLLGTRGLPDPSSFQRLRETREEAMAIADLFIPSEDSSALARLHSLRRQRSGSLSGRHLDLYLGDRASRGRLQGAAAVQGSTGNQPLVGRGLACGRLLTPVLLGALHLHRPPAVDDHQFPEELRVSAVWAVGALAEGRGARAPAWLQCRQLGQPAPF